MNGNRQIYGWIDAEMHRQISYKEDIHEHSVDSLPTQKEKAGKVHISIRDEGPYMCNCQWSEGMGAMKGVLKDWSSDYIKRSVLSFTPAQLLRQPNCLEQLPLYVNPTSNLPSPRGYSCYFRFREYICVCQSKTLKSPSPCYFSFFSSLQGFVDEGKKKNTLFSHQIHKSREL